METEEINYFYKKKAEINSAFSFDRINQCITERTIC